MITLSPDIITDEGQSMLRLLSRDNNESKCSSERDNMDDEVKWIGLYICTALNCIFCISSVLLVVPW